MKKWFLMVKEKFFLSIKNPTTKKRLIAGSVLVFLVIIGGVSYWYWEKEFSPRSPYSEVYTLTLDKISKSAPIKIFLPDNIDPEMAKNQVRFDPTIQGAWIENPDEKTIAFKPDGDLEVGKYYAVTLSIDGKSIRHQFLVDENPSITAIFPASDSETHEDSEITILFNRPMVALTTLDVLEEKEIPVEITPATEGKYKWITTRNLQFIPKEDLVRSSHYKVAIQEGLQSIDGLEVPSFEHAFITRKLRYDYLTHNQVIYNAPITIYFNQDVDLEKTQKEIAVFDITSEEKAVDIVVEYGKRKIFDEETRTYKEELDKSRLSIFQKKDEFGRDKLWNFEHRYRLKIQKAYPTEGDIILEEARETEIQVPPIVSGTRAESERTSWSREDFFDPLGKFITSFYEEIDLEKTKIRGDHIKEIQYGTKCRELKEGEEVRGDIECEKIPNKMELHILFDHEKIGKASEAKISLEKIVNVDGLEVNKHPFGFLLKTVPALQVEKITPAELSQNASVTDLKICTTTPLVIPDKKDIDTYLKVKPEYQFNYWRSSYRVREEDKEKPCAVGNFVTAVEYGLMPDTLYEVNLHLEDHFGETRETSTRFVSGKMPREFLNFYHYQDRYVMTLPGRTKLTYAVNNMEYVNLEVCELPVERMLYFTQKRLDYWQAFPTSECRRVIHKTIPLQKKFWVKNFFQVQLKDIVGDSLGHYVLSFSHPNYKDSRGKMVYERNYISITELLVTEKKVNRDFEERETDPLRLLSEEDLSELHDLYWISKTGSLKPVQNATVERYAETGSPYDNNYKIEEKDSITTDENGVARGVTINNLGGVIVRSGKDSAILALRETSLSYASNAFREKKIYLYSDRPIYRPTHEVFLKGIYRVGYDGDFEILEGKEIDLIIRDSQNKVSFQQKLPLNEYGTFYTSWVIPENASLGTYEACVDKYECHYFSVEEYVAAPFKLETRPEKNEYISGDITRIDIDADYYFGAPVEGGEVEYTFVSQDYYFDKYEDEYFSFGRGWYRCYDGCRYGDRFLFRKKIPLREDGTASLEEKIDFSTLFPKEEERGSKIIVVYITVKNTNGQSISTQQSFIVHAGEFYVGVKADPSYLAKNETTKIRIKTVDTSGKVVSRDDLLLDISRIETIQYKRKEVDGGYYYRWEDQYTSVLQKEFDTNRDGDFELEHSFGEEGRYRVRTSGKDDRGNLLVSDSTLYVYGDGRADVIPRNDTSLDLEAQKTNLDVGEKAEVIIQSPFLKAKALFAIERGKIFQYEILPIEGNLIKYSFDIRPEYVPNIYFSALVISPDPEVRYGSLEFQVSRDEKELQIDVKANKEFYLPGEEVSLDILAKDSHGNPVSAEFSVAVVDMSVLALKGNPKKNPVVFFYDGFPLTIQTSSNVKKILHEIEVLPGKGGGGGDPESLAKKKRGVFKDTAFWEAAVRTDQNGKAHLQFVLPDNLTTWQIESLGITKDTKVGVSYKDFMARKDLMLVPIKPRFIVPGDEFLIGAKVFNQTGKEQELQVSLSSSTLSGEKTEKLTLKADETKTVFFETAAPKNIERGIHTFTLSAKNPSYEDTVENAIKITRNETFEVTATANSSFHDIETEYVYLPEGIVEDRGELKVRGSATLAVFLSDALQSMISYPYGCAEQIASRLSTIASILNARSIKNIGEKLNLAPIEYDGVSYTPEELVNIGLSDLYSKAASDGGFRYYNYSDRSNFYLTLHVVNTLGDIRDAGFEVNQGVLDRARSYLEREVQSKNPQYQHSKDDFVLVAYTLGRTENESSANPPLEDKILEIMRDEKYIKEDISTGTLTYLAMTLSNKGYNSRLKEKVFDQLENRIDIDARGSFLKNNPRNFLWQYYENDIRNTALFVRALSEDERESVLIDKLLRFLLASRDKNGTWNSTNTTVSVVEAMTQYLKWSKEGESQFDLEVLLNDQNVANKEFRPDTILEELNTEIPVEKFPLNTNSTVKFLRKKLNDLKNTFYYDMALRYFLPIENIAPRDEGFSITREFYRLDDWNGSTPLKEAKVGEVIRGKLTIYVPQGKNVVAVEDFIPAGFELVNFNLKTEELSILGAAAQYENNEAETRERESRKKVRNMFYPDFQEKHDDRVFLFKERVLPGIYEFDYYLRALVPGTFHHLPAVVSELYFPENFGRTRGEIFSVTQSKEE